MKKLLLLVGILTLAVSSNSVFATEATTPKGPVRPVPGMDRPCPDMMRRPPMAPNRVNFEKRLNLSEEQKAKAKVIHQKGFEEIKPIMDKLQLKREEMEAVKRSKLAPEAQAERIMALRKESRELMQQTREIRMKNMKEFEAILTDKQKKELKKIKEEGRKNFEKNRKKHPMPPSSR